MIDIYRLSNDDIPWAALYTFKKSSKGYILKSSNKAKTFGRRGAPSMPRNSCMSSLVECKCDLALMS